MPCCSSLQAGGFVGEQQRRGGRQALGTPCELQAQPVRKPCGLTRAQGEAGSDQARPQRFACSKRCAVTLPRCAPPRLPPGTALACVSAGSRPRARRRSPGRGLSVHSVRMLGNSDCTRCATCGGAQGWPASLHGVQPACGVGAEGRRAPRAERAEAGGGLSPAARGAAPACLLDQKVAQVHASQPALRGGDAVEHGHTGGPALPRCLLLCLLGMAPLLVGLLRLLPGTLCKPRSGRRSAPVACAGGHTANCRGRRGRR